MAESGNVTNINYLYELLGCDELSSKEQIIAEYKIKAKSLHPDKNSGDIETTDEFITLTKARDILCDKEKRKQYDSWRHSGLEISFDVWLKVDQSNHMSMHWAPLAKKEKMIESCEVHTSRNSGQSPLEMTNKSSAKETSESFNNCYKTVAPWERKTSWGDSKLSRFRNYKI